MPVLTALAWLIQNTIAVNEDEPIKHDHKGNLCFPAVHECLRKEVARQY